MRGKDFDVESLLVKENKNIKQYNEVLIEKGY